MVSRQRRDRLAKALDESRRLEKELDGQNLREDASENERLAQSLESAPKPESSTAGGAD